jgi:hypothetical protein
LTSKTHKVAKNGHPKKKTLGILPFKVTLMSLFKKKVNLQKKS